MQLTRTLQVAQQVFALGRLQVERERLLVLGVPGVRGQQREGLAKEAAGRGVGSGRRGLPGCLDVQPAERRFLLGGGNQVDALVELIDDVED